MSDVPAGLTDDLSDASNILVMEDGDDSVHDRVHETLLADFHEGSADLFVATFSQPGPWLDAWADDLAIESSHLGLVHLTDGTVDEGYRGGAYVRGVSPGDLTGLGMAVRDFFDGVSSRSSPTVVCFDSLSELTAYHDARTLFRFLRVITQQITREDAVGHFHLNPVAHDSQSLARLRPPFDAEVECSDASGVSVSRTH